MRTLDRYLSLIFMRNFIFSTLVLVFIFMFQAFFGEYFNMVYTARQVIIYNLLNIPQITAQMIPPAVMLSTVLTLSGLSRSNELVACYGAGVGIGRITSLILSIVFVISCVVVIIDDRVLPPTFKRRTAYYWRVMKQRPDFFMDLKQDKIWYRSKNMIYNLKLFDTKATTIHGMSVYTFDGDFNLVQVVDAERASFSHPSWKLVNGTVTVFTADDPFPMTQKFSEKELVIPETPKDFQEIEKEVDGLRLKELYRYIQRMKDAGADTKSYEVKFHSRISLSFIPLVMSLLGVPFSIRKRREGGPARDFGICMAFTFFYWLFYSVGLSLGTNGALPPWLAAWLPSVIFAVLAVALLFRLRT